MNIPKKTSPKKVALIQNNVLKEMKKPSKVSVILPNFNVNSGNYYASKRNEET